MWAAEMHFLDINCFPQFLTCLGCSSARQSQTITCPVCAWLNRYPVLYVRGGGGQQDNWFHLYALSDPVCRDTVKLCQRKPPVSRHGFQDLDILLTSRFGLESNHTCSPPAGQSVNQSDCALHRSRLHPQNDATSRPNNTDQIDRRLLYLDPNNRKLLQEFL